MKDWQFLILAGVMLGIIFTLWVASVAIKASIFKSVLGV